MRPSAPRDPWFFGIRIVFSILCLLAVGFALAASPGADAARGELLYDTHCIACHNAQVHWRGRKLVTDWASLRDQVRRWQDIQRLGWREDDIILVARYLNERYYQVRETGDRGGPSAALLRPASESSGAPR